MPDKKQDIFIVMELKDAIQKIKAILNMDEAPEVIETPEEVVEEVVEAPIVEETTEQFNAEAFKESIVADLDVRIETLKADLKAEFDAKIEAVEAKNKESHSKIAEILSQVAETPEAEPTEPPKTLLSEAAQTKVDRIKKTAETMKQYREQNKK